MNKYYIDGVIVVEGKSDVSYLSLFIDSLFFITNGYDINDEKINFLKRVSEVNRIIVLTDNDQAGTDIENKIKSKIERVFIAKTGKIYRKNQKKRGVAETDKQEIINALKPYMSSENQKGHKLDYNLSKVISLSRKPDDTRASIINEYRLIDGNNKFLNDELNMLKIDIDEFINKYGN